MHEAEFCRLRECGEWHDVQQSLSVTVEAGATVSYLQAYLGSGRVAGGKGDAQPGAPRSLS